MTVRWLRLAPEDCEDLARRLADDLQGGLGYVLLGMQPIGPFLALADRLVYLGDLPVSVVERGLRVPLQPWADYWRSRGMPSALAERLRQELCRRAREG
jgi:hypothetical protein